MAIARVGDGLRRVDSRVLRIRRQRQNDSALDPLLTLHAQEWECAGTSFNLADAGVRVLAFDRATLFLFDGNTAAVTRTIYADIGTSPVQLPVTPEPPTRAQHTTHLPAFPAICAPIMVEGRLTAGLLLDNLYSRDPIPGGALQAVMDLCTQVVIALQKANLVEQLNAKARHDDLTGLCRVEHFYHVADDILSRGEDDLTASGLMMIDIDYFKQVNDSYVGPMAAQTPTTSPPSRLPSTMDTIVQP